MKNRAVTGPSYISLIAFSLVKLLRIRVCALEEMQNVGEQHF